MTFENMWMITKTIVLAGSVIIIVKTGAPFYDKMLGLMDKKEELYNEQIVRISENMISQRIEFSNKLLQEQIKGLNDQIKNIADQRNQDIIAMGNIVAQLGQDLSEQKGDTYVDAADTSKNYVETVINKKMSDNSEIPWGWAMYSPNIQGEEKWTSGSYPVELHTKIAIGKNPDRSDAYVEAYMTSDVFNKDKGKKFPITVDSVDWIESPPGEKKWMYNPRISLGMGLSTAFFPSLDFSFFSYGRTKADMDWRFLSIGGGFTGTNSYIYFAPAEYNLGNVAPYVKNLFISPFIGMDQDSDAVIGVQLQIPF